jgi:2-polyprenyl-3-methyl-5-hydroxy-6-metoxy-1,4-benzoquinol methylase
VNGENRPPTTDAIQQAAKRLDFQATKRLDYAERLQHLEAAWWKRLLDVQRPYRWNLRRSHLGCTLDLGCGIGRNLMNLDPGSVGIDHNRHSVAVARERGLTAYTTDEFLGSALSRPASFDSMLVAHVVEHMPIAQARELVSQYLPMIKPGGMVLFICPQEKGYASDPTHASFTDEAALRELAQDIGLHVLRSYSFPLPRAAGRFFRYNEFCVLASRSARES